MDAESYRGARSATSRGLADRQQPGDRGLQVTLTLTFHSGSRREGEEWSRETHAPQRTLRGCSAVTQGGGAFPPEPDAHPQPRDSLVSEGIQVLRSKNSQNNAPLTPLPQMSTGEYVSLHGKRDFEDVSEVKDLAMGRLSWMLKWAPCNKNGETFLV